MESKTGLVYTGRIISMDEISGVDFISCATVVCGNGGKWKGVVRKTEFSNVGELCYVFLPDSLIPESEDFSFMKSSNWRVKMRRFRGAPSEVLIIPFPLDNLEKHPMGSDVTYFFGVTKYHKPVPIDLQGKVKGEFPAFNPKSDVPNYQSSEGQECIEKLKGQPYYITEKADGSSTTAYKYKGKFGICSRNWELERDENIGYWKIAIQHNLEEKLPEGIAIQWETCGPQINGNPMQWQSIVGLLFSAYNIEEKRYLTFIELCELSDFLNFPMVMILKSHPSFSPDGIELWGEGNYDNGTPREGVVVRSTYNLLDHKPISFKVINLNYEN